MRKIFIFTIPPPEHLGVLEHMSKVLKDVVQSRRYAIRSLSSQQETYLYVYTVIEYKTITFLLYLLWLFYCHELHLTYLRGILGYFYTLKIGFTTI